MSDPRPADTSVFPNAVYKETVLRPLFDGAKADHVDGFRQIDRAHLVMLEATGILTRPQAAAIARALAAIDAEMANPLLYRDAQRATELARERAALLRERDRLEDEWLAASSEKEAVEQEFAQRT